MNKKDYKRCLKCDGIITPYPHTTRRKYCFNCVVDKSDQKERIERETLTKKHKETKIIEYDKIRRELNFKYTKYID